jgi:hypothetical protein
MTYVVKNNLIAVRYLKSDEFRFNVDGSYDEPALRSKEFGLLYGRTLRKEYLELSMSTGVAYIDAIERGNRIEGKQFESVRISTMGIPFEARFRIDLGVISLGGAWYGDINNKRLSSGAMLEISLEMFGD